MKQIVKSISIFVLFLSLPLSSLAEGVIDKVSSFSQVKKVKELESPRFAEKFVAYFEQPVDYNHPEAGTFLQRVFVCNVHPDSMTVVVTEGYGAQYAAMPRYIEELSSIFNTNIVVVEHRYFLESTPAEKNWEFLTAENCANDLHNVVTAFKTIYDGKWIATGISKGGQTATLYRTFFPEDVDVTVPYVAPLCRGVEDGRHEPFIANYAGTPEDRKKLKEFQLEFLKRKSTILPKFDSLSKADGLEYNLPLNEIYDYCVLEFPFAFWQWGRKTEELPSIKASDNEYFKYLIAVSGPDYFVKESDTSPFFIQAAKELGYYGYDTKPFKKYLDIRSAKGYLKKIFLPQKEKKGDNFEFDATLYKKISAFLPSTDSKMLFIYGQYDPWSAVMVSDPKKENIKIFIDPEGSHRARIASFSEETQAEIKTILTNWLYN